MDIYANRVPVRTFGSGTSYDNKVWYKLTSAIRSVNGRDVDSSSLNKSMLIEGDKSHSRVRTKRYWEAWSAASEGKSLNET